MDERVKFLIEYLNGLTKAKREKKIRDIVFRVWNYRQSNKTYPEGSSGASRRWIPDAREDCDGDGTCVRAPSRGWPYSYRNRCKTRQHCKVLVLAGLEGRDVPNDVRGALINEAAKLNPLTVLAAQA